MEMLPARYRGRGFFFPVALPVSVLDINGIGGDREGWRQKSENKPCAVIEATMVRPIEKNDAREQKNEIGKKKCEPTTKAERKHVRRKIN